LVRREHPAAEETANSASTIRDLVHELRQPLSSIEAIAYFLEMTLPADQIQARQYMHRLQQLVDQAASILDRMGSLVRKQPVSPRAVLERINAELVWSGNAPSLGTPTLHSETEEMNTPPPSAPDGSAGQE
jgi:nitrogen-specific signal transduction histidine kinase